MPEFRESTYGRQVNVKGGRLVQGGVAFDPPNCQEITKQGVNCRGPRAKGTMYCVGHLRARGELDGG